MEPSISPITRPETLDMHHYPTGHQQPRGQGLRLSWPPWDAGKGTPEIQRTTAEQRVQQSALSGMFHSMNQTPCPQTGDASRANPRLQEL